MLSFVELHFVCLPFALPSAQCTLAPPPRGQFHKGLPGKLIYGAVPAQICTLSVTFYTTTATAAMVAAARLLQRYLEGNYVLLTKVYLVPGIWR